MKASSIPMTASISIPAPLSRWRWRPFSSCLGPHLLALALVSILESGGAPAKPHLLGPTGMFGQTAKSEIQVEKVEKGSPAEGRIKPGDVITGAGGGTFKADARKEIAAAIDRAEAGGMLELNLKGGGKVDLPIAVLGSFSDTAPYDCAKTERIVTRIADKMLETKSYAKSKLAVGWLGLMATGEKKYLDVVKAELPKQEWAHPDPAEFAALLRGEKDMGYVGWYWGYQLMALCEYHLLTGDKSVLPAIKTYALTLSRGQDPAGTWGHRMATKGRGGRLPGYAHINQPSLSCLIGMELARKCGVDDPELTKALDKSIGFFRTFVGEGSIPYGVHDPKTSIFNNNGSSAMAALAMALHGDEQGARFFSSQAAAAYDILETGHATHYFNVLWTPLGASLAGPEVTQEFFKRARWLHTSYRGWDDVFTFDGGESKACNSPGSLLLAYCLPRRQLFITGKQANESLWAKGDQVADIIGASQIDFKSLSVDELIGLFGHPAPQVTRRAVWSLREREGDFLPKVVALIKNGTDIEKRSAIGFFGYQCPPVWVLPQLELLGSVLRDTKESPKVRASAAGSLACHGESARKFYADMLRFVLEDKPGDSFGMVDKDVAASLVALSPDPFKDGLVTDKPLFYAAVDKLADHPRQGVRADAMQMLRHMPVADFPQVAEKVRHVTLNRDPNYHSYHNPMSSVQQGAVLLAELGVQEGMEWGWEILEVRDGKGGFKVRAILSILAAYGPHAKPYLDRIRNNPARLRMLSSGRWKRMFDNMVKAVETPAKPSVKLISFDEAKKGVSQ